MREKLIKAGIAINLISALFILYSFSSTNISYQTECFSTDSDGYVIIKIWNTKKGKKYKSNQARKEAIHAILYSGISQGNGCNTQTPILNKSEEQDSFKNIESTFFSNKGEWSRFTRSSTIETTLPVNLGLKNWKVYQVAISKNELRKFLEERKIIKSLSNGF